MAPYSIYNDDNRDNVYEPELPKGVTSKLIKNPNNTFKREFKDGTSEEFNASGYLTAVVDRNGNRITLTRGTGNKLTKITDPSGREINITNNTSNKITSITLPDGKVLSYTYLSGYGYLGSVTYPDGSTKNYEYVYITGKGYRLSGVKNEKGNYIEKHTYDSQGRAITSSADGTNEKLTINYDTQITVTDSLGRVTTYTINKSKGKSHIVEVSGPGCKECGQGNVSYMYNDKLRITQITDANGNITKFTYDSNGNMLTKTEAFGTAIERTTTYTYEPTFNQLASITDPLGNTTTFTMTPMGTLHP
jgi:YD repeat-containing protein